MNRQPNLVYLLADDLGVRDLGCFGSTFYETPNLDRLASQGLRHERAYAACAVCSPTRAAILSGKSPARIGCTNFIPDSQDTAVRAGRLREVPFLHYLPHGGTTLPQALREGGYQTWHVGKWHLGDEPFHPEHHGFDVNLGGCHWGLPMQGYQAPWGIPTLDDGHVPEGTWLDEHLTERAIELLRERDPERPFFLNLWYYLVHSPYQAPEALVEKYRRKAARLGFDPDASLVPGEPQPMIGREHKRVTRRRYQCEPLYAAMVEQLDRCVGRLLDALDDLGLAEDTLLVFTSDNGGDAATGWPPTTNLPYREGKGWGEEGGLRVAQIVRWPGRIEAGRISQLPTISTDTYPTFLAAAGLPQRPDEHPDGVDLSGHWLRGDTPARDALCWHYPHYSNQGGTPHAAILAPDGRWKLLWFFEDDRCELYDLLQDPSEIDDRSAHEPGRCAAMHAQLRAWQQAVTARLPEPNPDWRAPAVPNNAYE